MRGVLILAASMALGAGCVPKRTYNDLNAKYSASQAEISKLQAEIKRRDEAAQARLEAFRELVADFKPLVDRGILQVEVVDGRVVIGMAADVLFPSGSAELSADGKSHLTEVARVLGRKDDRDFQVEGHTDSDPIASDRFPNNWYLGAARAITVVEFLVDHGMKPEQVSAASFGQYAPDVPNNSAANKAKNRRIEIVLLPDLSDLPGYEVLMREAKGGHVRRPPRTKPGGPAPQPSPPPKKH